jgi:Cdc6-like AAA superfamily ATPase
LSKPVNLRAVRKRAARDAARQRGDQNAARHGLSKTERASERSERNKATAHLDGHRRETQD